MRELIIGGDGRVGGALRKHLLDADWTTRRATEPGIYFDMLNPTELPHADIVYICAGVNGALTVAQNPQTSYRTNVDGTIWIAEHYRPKERTVFFHNGTRATLIDGDTFVVWVSSTTVEWQLEGYGNQKRITEQALRVMPHVGIVRAGRVLQPEIDRLCSLMIHIGRTRKRGVTLWGEDEKPYSG